MTSLQLQTHLVSEPEMEMPRTGEYENVSFVSEGFLPPGCQGASLPRAKQGAHEHPLQLSSRLVSQQNRRHQALLRGGRWPPGFVRENEYLDLGE